MPSAEDNMAITWKSITTIILISTPLVGVITFLFQLQADILTNRTELESAISSVASTMAKEFASRDPKLDFVYNQATKGDRFTKADGEALTARLSHHGERIGKLETNCDVTQERDAAMAARIARLESLSPERNSREGRDL